MIASKFLIPVNEIKEETRVTFDNIEANDIDLKVDNVEKFCSIRALVMINNSAIGITADFNVTFTAELKCGRCLTNFSRDFPVSLFLIYIHGKDPHAKAEKVDLQTSEVERIYFSGTNIDLSIGIREAIVLSIPIAPVCDSACKGLCPVCGTNKNKNKCKCKIKEESFFTPIPVKRKTGKKRRKK
jgi:uncharacterized protein